VVAAPSPAWKWMVNLPGTTGVAPSALSGPGMVPTLGVSPRLLALALLVPLAVCGGGA
jgi:hypothetical protein